MGNLMLISIITPTYNSEYYIRETIRSVQQQTFADWEMLVVDDCSSDSTLSIIKELASHDARIRILPLAKNSGAAIARNTALDAAIGTHIAFLDADDLWLPEKLEKQIAFMGNNVAMSFTAYQVIDKEGVPTNKTIDLDGMQCVNYRDMLQKKATLGCSTVMLNRNKLSMYRMPIIRTGQDYALWLRILKDGHNAYCLPEILTQYRIVPGSISRNKVKKALRQWQIYREFENIGLLPSAWFFMNYAYRAISR
jgi:glycosyltransferase involved in cell wall biosynthesis